MPTLRRATRIPAGIAVVLLSLVAGSVSAAAPLAPPVAAPRARSPGVDDPTPVAATLAQAPVLPGVGDDPTPPGELAAPPVDGSGAPETLPVDAPPDAPPGAAPPVDAPPVDAPPVEAPPPGAAAPALPPIQRPTSLAPAKPAGPPASPRAETPPARPTAPPAARPAPHPSDAPTPAPPPSVAPTPAPAPEAPVPEDSRSRRDDPRRWRHAGFILDLQVGTGGCRRAFCGAAGHDAAPGARLGGFVGGNIFGILEVGLSAGWNTLRPRDVAGRNALELYGLDPQKVADVIATEMGVPALAVDLASLTVASATSRAFDIGPALRVHFIRKGRGLAYVGADIHYQLWRNRYATAGGDLRLDFHGISAPLRVGGGAHVHRNIAVVGEFSYVFATFVVGRIHHPMLDAAAPLRALESKASEVASGLTRGMPHFWNLTVNLRFRF